MNEEVGIADAQNSTASLQATTALSLSSAIMQKMEQVTSSLLCFMF